MADQQHIVGSFDRDLEGVQAAAMKIGGLVEQALANSVRALEKGDVDLAEKIRTGDRAIDELDLALKSDSARLLALRSPTASDLRMVLSAMEISSHLERCGDYAANIAKRTIAMAGIEDISGSRASLRRMGDFVEAMIKDALDAYIRHDTALAKAVIARDAEADQIYNTLFRALLTHMMEDPRSIATGMHYHFIAKNIERVGDHATVIAEQTLYLITGELPEHERPKMDQTSLDTIEDNG